MKQILCFGDSNTYGLIPKTQDRYIYDIRWTGRLDSLLQPHGFRVVEEGLCGRTTVFEDQLRYGRRGVDFLPVVLETHSPLHGVVIMLGTNDCKTIYGASAEVIGKGIEKLIDQVKSINPELYILLISPIHLGEGVWTPDFDPEFNISSVETSKRLKEIYSGIAKKRGCDFLGASEYASPSQDDLEHLDQTGHEILARAVYTKLAESLLHKERPSLVEG